MKEWEIDKINDLYKELDKVGAENRRLRDAAIDASISKLETKVDTCIELLLKATASPRTKNK